MMCPGERNLVVMIGTAMKKAWALPLSSTGIRGNREWVTYSGLS